MPNETHLDYRRTIHGEVIVDAPISACWRAWTTEAGIRSFFAPDCKVALRVGGPFEMYFLLENAPGLRGGEGNVVLAFQQEKMLSFSWNAPPNLPDVREQRTHVTLYFYQQGPERTRITLDHDGWGSGGQWDEAFDYFRRAWLEMVLPSLQETLSGAAQ